MIGESLAVIARDPIPERPGRGEPRAKKRRTKNHQLHTQPKPRMGNLPHPQQRPLKTS